MPLAAPPPVFTPPSAGLPPAAAGAVFTPPSAGSPPAAAGAVFTPPSAGSPPDAPDGIFTPPASAAPVGMAVTGVSDPSGANGFYPVAGQANGKDFYQLGIYRLRSTGTEWVLEPDSGLLVYFSSNEDVATIDLVTEWTPDVGSGPLLVLESVAPSPVIFTPPSAGSPPAAAGAIFTPPSAGSPPSAPGAVFTTPTGGAAPSSPPPIFGMPLNGLYNSDYAPLLNSDSTPLENQPLAS